MIDGMAEPLGVATRRLRTAAGHLADAGTQTGERALIGGVEVLADRGFGPARALGATRDKIAPYTSRSPHAAEGIFANREAPVGASSPTLGMAAEMARRPGWPNAPIPVVTPQFPEEVGALSATWLGHASVLVEIDGVRVLTDPVFSDRCSPSQVFGPRRMYRAPAPVAELPPIDVVLLSHDHYDHLDVGTIDALAALGPQTQFVVPIGVDAHLVAWGIDPARIHSADWHEELTLKVRGTELRFAAVPTRHFSGRGLIRNLTQWVSWVVIGPEYRFFFSGDTGFTERYSETGDRFGPFDLTLIAAGAYDPAWPDIHLNPEEAVSVHHLLNPGSARESLLLPIHWGTFNLALHRWADPIQRLLSETSTAGVPVVVPRPGSTAVVDKRNGTAFDDPTWWERCA